MAVSSKTLTDVVIQQTATNAVQRLGYSTIKDEQLQVVAGVLRGLDVFAVLPTGFGKSLCFSCLPWMFDSLLPVGEPSIVVIVAPLTAIMKDQVSSLQARGITACYIAGDQHDENIKKGVRKGDYQLVIFTPEMILDSKKWRRLFLGEVYSTRLRVFVIDEAHTLKKWGDTFRPALLRIGEIRSLLPPNVNVLALTATASTELRIQIAKMLSMKNELVVSLSPCKPNIMYAVSSFDSIEVTFDPLIIRLSRERASFPRMIIYCRRIEECADLYMYFRDSLGPDFTEPSGAPDLTKFRLVDMYLSCSDSNVKECIIAAFTKQSTLRIVIATIAFGMGVDCHDIRQVIHLGSPGDMESYVQETGRAGRDGLTALALLLHKKSSDRYTEKPMIDYVTNKDHCRRDKLFEKFDGYTHKDMGTLCSCCDVCMSSCHCQNCVQHHKSFVFL